MGTRRSSLVRFCLTQKRRTCGPVDQNFESVLSNNIVRVITNLPSHPLSGRENTAKTSPFQRTKRQSISER